MKSARIKFLYQKGISAAAIARQVACSPNTVRSKLLNMGLKLRSRSEARMLQKNFVKITKNKLYELYSVKKFSIYDIARKYNCYYSAIRQKMIKWKITRRSIMVARALVPPKYPRHSCPADPILCAYIIGFRLGDLYVHRATPTSHTIVVQTNSTKLAQIELFHKIFDKFGHVHVCSPDKNGARLMRCDLDWSFNFLLPKKDFIPSWIQKNRSCFSAFFAGYVDAEGSFAVVRRHRCFQVKTGDKGIIQQSAKLLKFYRIIDKSPYLIRKAGVRDINNVPSKKDIWGIVIYDRVSLKKIISFISPHMKHVDRIIDMKKVLKSLQKIKYV